MSFTGKYGVLIIAGVAIIFLFGYWLGSPQNAVEKTEEPSYETLSQEENWFESKELRKGEDPSPGFLPQKVGNFRLSQKLGGKETLPVVSSFLGTELQVENCYVPYYRDEEKEVIWWAFELKEDKLAVNLFDLMTEGLRESDSFSKMQEWKLEEGNRVDGSLIVHTQLRKPYNNFQYLYFYHREEWVFWLMTSKSLNKEEIRDFYLAVPS